MSSIVVSYNYDVVSLIQVENERPVLFPAVTICDSNPFTSKEAENLIRLKFNEAYGIDSKELNYSQIIQYSKQKIIQLITSIGIDVDINVSIITSLFL